MASNTSNALPGLSPTMQKQLIELAGLYTLDPLGFAEIAFPWSQPGTPLAKAPGLRGWQRRALTEIGERLRAGHRTGNLMPVRKAFASGHGVGKGALIAILILWAMSTCVDARVVLTAGTEGQLKTKS